MSNRSWCAVWLTVALGIIVGCNRNGANTESTGETNNHGTTDTSRAATVTTGTGTDGNAPAGTGTSASGMASSGTAAGGSNTGGAAGGGGGMAGAGGTVATGAQRAGAR